MKFFLIHRKRPNMLKKFWDKFTDDQELIRFKLSSAMIIMIFGLWYLGGM